MDTKSFLTGLVAGAGAAVIAVVAVPGIVPGSGRDGAPRAPHSTVVVVQEPAPVAPAPPPPAPGPPPASASAKGVDSDAVRAKEPAIAGDLHVRLSRETAVIATLRNIVSAQAQFQATARADEDSDGVGEYGSFGELSGAVGVRDGRVLNPPVLSSAFRKVEGGRVERGGYWFRIYLPQAGGLGISERHGGGFAAREPDADLAETTWCCYAWPVEGDGRAFFVNQAGDVLATADGDYACDREPHFSAAFAPDSVGIIGSTALASGTSCDRHAWKQAG